MEYKKMLFDACSSQSEPRLLQLAGLKDPEISKLIAQNVFITEAVALEIFADYPHELLSNTGFTRQGKLNPQFMQDLFTRHYRLVPTLILPVTWFRYLLGHASPDVRRSAASNPNLQKQFHEQCVNSADTALRMGIANNPNLAYNLLSHLRSDSDPQIKAIANQNSGNFSLTIKLPNPASAAASMAISKPTELIDSNGSAQDFAELQLTEMQLLEASSAALTTIQSKIPKLAVPSRGLPMLIIAALSLLSLGLLVTLWSLLAQRGSVTPVSTANLSASLPTSKPFENTADVAIMNRAIEIANTTSLAAQQFPDKSGWQNISSQWKEAIDLLTKIPSTSKLYPAAQAKIRTYRVILATAMQNAQQ
jgi:hypothetical protein